MFEICKILHWNLEDTSWEKYVAVEVCSETSQIGGTSSVDTFANESFRSVRLYITHLACWICFCSNGIFAETP